MNMFAKPVNEIMKPWLKGIDKSREIFESQNALLGRLDTEIAKTPYEVVYEEDRIRLKHYSPKGDKRINTPLLVIYALVNRETMLDLQPGRSVIENFINMGVDTYLIDWGYPTRKDRFLTIDDHVNGYMDNLVDFIRDRHGIEKINLLGTCMGGTFSVIYSALHPEKIKNLVTSVAPTNFETDEGLLHLLARNMDFGSLIDAYGNLPGDLLNLGFLLLNPARLVIDKYVGFFGNVGDKNFIENFVRMEKWIFDSPDVPGETVRQFMEDLYKKNLLIQNKMEVGGKHVDLGNITMPLLNFYGKFDHLVPPAACNLLSSRVGTSDTEDVCIETGHIGIYVSSKSQKEFTPKIVEWLKQREDVPEIKAGDEAHQAAGHASTPAPQPLAKERPQKKIGRKAALRTSAANVKPPAEDRASA